jgi:glycosyltransferase involved in cell wall biosynthesis
MDMNMGTASAIMHSGTPLLSLIIPHYNHNASLPRLLDSIMAQTMRDFEVIVVDDCSEESCADVVEAYASRSLPVRLVQNQTRRYTKNCRLAGVEASRGSIIAFADADDELLGTETLAYHSRMLERENADMVQFPAMETDASLQKNSLLPCGWSPEQRLEGGSIFASYVAAGLHPSYLWNKLYTRGLWEKILPAARKGERVRYFEDLFLHSLLCFHAGRLVNSDKTGYRHFYEDKRRLKAEGRIATLIHILHELVPYFEALGSDVANVDRYAECIKAQLRRNLEHYFFRYDRPLREALLSWVVGERDERDACVIGVDRMRGLVGVACLASSTLAEQRFQRNGQACEPVFQKSFPLGFMPKRGAFLHILWFAADTKDTLTGVIDDAPVSFMTAKSAASLSAAPARRNTELSIGELTARKGSRPAPRHHLVAFLARLPFVQRQYQGAWLFMDRDYKADDNAEHLYRWVMRQHPEQKIYFGLDNSSPDWQRLKKEGFNLLDCNSLSYYFAWLHCSWLISSNRTDYILRSQWRRWYADIIKHHCCFLQHGVTMSHQSSMNCPHLDMVITAAQPEYKAFAENPQYHYVYSRREVRLTGFPRHDALVRKASFVRNPRRILIMPTWRAKLVTELIPRTGLRAYNPEFRRSDFFQQWQAVLSSQDLRDAAAKHGYHLVFYPHPYLRQQMRDFTFDGIDLLPDVGGSIQEIISKSALLLTDYSSISMEFALIRRPVLYFQFDHDTFYAGQPFEQGYFDYQRDGFGQIAYTAQELCALAKESLHSGCRMPAEYRRRAERFFAFSDQENCHRVYEAIVASSGVAS